MKIAGVNISPASRSSALTAAIPPPFGCRVNGMEDGKDLVLVEIDSGVEDIKLRYILEREVAEHLRRKQEHPLKILRGVSEEEAQRLSLIHISEPTRPY